MTQAQYARHWNNSPQYIGKLVKAGVLVIASENLPNPIRDGVGRLLSRLTASMRSSCAGSQCRSRKRPGVQ